MERAGIDIITDGEIRRESYSNRFATALEGIDTEQPGRRSNARRAARRRCRASSARSAARGRWRCATCSSCARNTDRPAKITLPGPFTMSQQAKNEFYRDEEEMVMDFAVAVNAEARDLEEAGADVIQLDEPWLRNDPDAAKRYRGDGHQPRAARASRCRPSCTSASATRRWCRADEADRLLVPAELADTTAQQISIEAAQPKLDLGVLKELAGKKIMLGVIDLGDPQARRRDGRRAHPRGPEVSSTPDKLIPAPDCGMKISAARPGVRAN